MFRIPILQVIYLFFQSALLLKFCCIHHHVQLIFQLQNLFFFLIFIFFLISVVKNLICSVKFWFVSHSHIPTSPLPPSLPFLVTTSFFSMSESVCYMHSCFIYLFLDSTYTYLSDRDSVPISLSDI